MIDPISNQPEFIEDIDFETLKADPVGYINNIINQPDGLAKYLIGLTVANLELHERVNQLEENNNHDIPPVIEKTANFMHTTEGKKALKDIYLQLSCEFHREIFQELLQHNIDLAIDNSRLKKQVEEYMKEAGY